MACCDICGAVFTLKNNLMRHIVVNHNENEPYPIKTCDQCDYSGTFTNLMYHKKNTHRETNLVCSLCNEEQSSKTNLNRHFPSVSITRKMHLLGFVIAPIIKNDKSDNVCYKFLKIEQLGEKIHAIWNLLHRARFFSIRNGCQRLLNIFLEYENSLYV